MHKCAVLVMTCDAYSDLWRPFFELFHRYWADCAFPVYLGTEKKTCSAGRVTTIAAGDGAWSKRLRVCLERIGAEYVLLLLDDFFLNRTVSNTEISRGVAFLESHKGTVLRLFPQFGPDVAIAGESEIGRIHALAPYRVSAQPAIWHVQSLAKLLRDEESAWDFEWRGTVRSRTSPDGFYATYAPIVSYRHVVERGEWFWTAAREYGRQDIGCDFSARRVMGPVTALRKKMHCLAKNTMLSLLPMKWRGWA